MARRYRYKTKLYSMQQLADMASVSYATMYARLNHYGYSVAKAVETPRSERGRPARNLAYAGHDLTIDEWSNLTGISHKTLEGRLRIGWTIEQALTTPTPKQRRRGVVFNFVPIEGTGAGSTAQEIPEITFSEQAENA